jgi:hypothetical protein
MHFFNFRFALLISQLFINKIILTVTTDSCVSGLSDLIFQIGESCSPPLPFAAGENARKSGFRQTKAYKSKTKINFADFFEYS